MLLLLQVVSKKRKIKDEKDYSPFWDYFATYGEALGKFTL